MPYKAIKKFEFDGVIFKIGDTVPDRLIVERLIVAESLVEEFTNVVETPKVELLLETPTDVEVASQEVKIEETQEEIKEEILVETKVETKKESKKDKK